MRAKHRSVILEGILGLSIAEGLEEVVQLGSHLEGRLNHCAASVLRRGSRRHGDLV